MVKPFAELAELGPAAVDGPTLVRMVGDLLGAEVTGLRHVRVEPVAYDVPAITTASRHWVRGEAVVATGPPRSWSLFCKVVQAWERHPFFAFVPPEQREVARLGVPWRTEPDVYRSDLAGQLPDGLTMPTAVAVSYLDDLSAAVWLPELEVLPVAWDGARYAGAAHRLGRLAGAAGVRASAAAVGHRNDPWTYLHGRLAGQVLPLLADDALWRHPLVAGAFGDLEARLRSAAHEAEALTAELAGHRLLASHGDAAPGNLLAVAGTEDLCLIDFGFFGPMPVGFDLGQLVAGEVQLGRDDGTGLVERDAACVAAYCRGLAEAGVAVAEPVVRRAHALQLVLYVGLSAVPFELLGEPEGAGLEPLAAARARLARLALDLLDATRA